MSNNTQRGEAMPTINVAINKCRLKSYIKDGKPTYYLKNGTEFSLEVFNPTTEMISARISLNGKKIGQGGLVLRPGERVFLDRYIDVAKKFKFETYEVSNTEEVRKAIEKNGDLTVTFHKEYAVQDYTVVNVTPWNQPLHIWNSPTVQPYTHDTNIYCANICNSDSTTAVGTSSLGLMSYSDTNGSVSPTIKKHVQSLGFKSRKSKSIETGRVEEGSHSTQKFTQVQITFNEIPFKTYEFNLLPESTKPITSSDLNSRRYCHNCGSKGKTTYTYCPSCGTKA